MIENRNYNGYGNRWDLLMPKAAKKELTSFGTRLVQLRTAAGFAQQELASEIGVSRRMIAYYEGETKHPPSSLLPAIAAALGISVDQLLSVQPIRRPKLNSGLQRRLQKIEKMEMKEKRHLLHLLDAFIEREELRRNTE